MSERLTSTTHGDAPVSAAHEPDARAAALEAHEDDDFVARTMTIARPATELYAFLGSVPNLRRILGEDAEVDWETIVLEEEMPGRALTWRSSGRDDDRRSSGRVELRDAPAGRGTEVTVTVVGEHRGVIGKAIDRITDRDPRRLSRHALRRFKQLMETGEIATSAPGPAAPRGD